MATLLQQLPEVLRAVLPKSAEEAINGTELLELVRPKLEGTYTDGTVRSHFSRLASDSTSPIARVESGYGYYLRPIASPPAAAAGSPPAISGAAPPTHAEDGGLALQQEEKFRALFMRYAELQDRFVMRIDHTIAGRSSAGVNRWKFPDVVVLDWDVGQVTDDGYRLNRDLLEVKRSLGDQPFRLSSIELKVSLTLRDFRESFFQCVSNSKWAHHSQLAVATTIDDATLVEELRRLGTSYDVTIFSYSLDAQWLKDLPSSNEIMKMSDADFENVAKPIRVVTVATGRQRAALDWEHINDMRSRTDDFVSLFQWIAHCLKDGKPFTYGHYQDIVRIDQNYR